MAGLRPARGSDANTAKEPTREAAMAPFAKGGDGNEALGAYLSGKLSGLVFQTVLSSGRSGRI
jgi:hypothetical protein